MSEIIAMPAVGLPGKFKNIAVLAGQHPVPPMHLITEQQLEEWLPNFAAIKASLADLERHIAITSGAFLTRDMAKIEAALDELYWSEQASASIFRFIATLKNDDGTVNLAVRSACQAEDLQEKSFAGIYESVLNVSADELQAAILTVLRSFYSLRAVMEKRHADTDETASNVNIIVQKMVSPSFSGVAFSCHPLTGEENLYVEYVSGLGEGLVSGEQEPQLLAASSDPQHQEALRQISEIVASAQILLGGHVDIEWAYEQGQVWLLQARPVTSGAGVSYSSEPEINVWPLYGELPTGLLEKLPEWALYFHQKRKPLADIARRYQKNQPGALILCCNSYAISDAALCEDWLEQFQGRQIVVDFSDAVRQLIIPKSDLIEQLKELMSEPGRLYTLVIRDFIKGEYGLITRKVQTPEGERLVAEISADGLLAINRGSAVSQVIALDTAEEGDILNRDAVRLLQQVTADALAALNDVQIEWVLANGQLYALDYSPIDDGQLLFTNDGRVMSQGYARGQAYLIADTEEIENYSIAPSMSLTDIPDISVYGDLFANIVREMEQLSSPPIVLARRPYAALASLMPWAAGFVFEKGSLLCHLGVLLRERKLPAVCDEQLFSRLQHGDIYVLDTHLIR
ncbi:PEP/pyruvate-binding domain-containing protein [Erwinia sp. BNK-24-b]|uniref:PEP/pyruvate-binding domain-containing protein n=1 Tax=unclassified Erwinia TaxID=2622719 RepID=UPI0039BFB4A4